MRRRAHREDGFVMVMALILTVVILGLAAAIVSASISTSDHSSHEYSRGAALSAAIAGLRAAAHRLSSQEEQTSAQLEDCFTNKFVAKESSGKCPAQGPEELGNGEKYSYYVSPALSKAANECTGLWVEAPSGRTLAQRCITAMGTANGTTERAQERVADLKGAGIWPTDGIFSYGSLIFNNNIAFNGEIGARGELFFNNQVEGTPPVTLKYGEKITKNQGACKLGASKSEACSEVKLTSAELAEAPYKLPEQSTAPFAESEISGSDKNITLSSGTINASRELTANAATTVKIPSGSYNLCYIFFNNTATIEYEPPVTVYLDSYNRKAPQASNCPNNSKSGTVEMNNQVNWVDLGKTPSASDLRFFAWGKPYETNSSAPKLRFNNNVSGPFYGEIYAPYSNVEFVNQLTMVGSIVAGYEDFNNKIEFTGSLGSGETSGSGASFYPTAYHVCTPSTSYSASGCY